MEQARSKLFYGTILTKIERTAIILKSEFPHITNNNCWQITQNGYWTGGFWIGLLWLSYTMTGDKKFMQWAYKWLLLLDERKNDRTFDLGFLFNPSFVLGYKITNNDYLRKTALEAADALATFFNGKLGFIYNGATINEKSIGRTIIDVMVNLPLLWWAYDETGDEKYYKVAYNHSKQTVKEFVRSDHSTIHVIYFDLEDGRMIKKTTYQGYNSDSCWSRGQAWAIYGFALAYKTSKDKIFLDVAEKLADYFIENLPADYVPYWDFGDPEIPNTVKDSSAAAIACSGLLTLSELSEKKDFKESALKILNSLSKNYLAEDFDGILKHGCFHKPKGIGIDESLIWGDYYFVEALCKLFIIDNTS